jgi:hypothetical protein
MTYSSGSLINQKKWILLFHFIIGAIIGVLLLHPLTTMVFWYEYKGLIEFPGNSPIEFWIQRLITEFKFELMPMSFVFALLGGIVGLLFGLYHIRLSGQKNLVRSLEHELAEELPLLIARGESEHLEFKSTYRWDVRQQRTNRALESIVIKTIAGFLNREGGTLLIGVEDNGNIIGIDSDFQTLKHKNRDGFERALMDTVKTSLGGNACALLHCRFHDIENKTICRVIVESAVEPVYYHEDSVARLMVRTGNSTRELDAREAHAYLSSRTTKSFSL